MRSRGKEREVKYIEIVESPRSRVELFSLHPAKVNNRVSELTTNN
jgi:hypothetical protein